jgi:hypothetical protein
MLNLWVLVVLLGYRNKGIVKPNQLTFVFKYSFKPTPLFSI